MATNFPFTRGLNVTMKLYSDGNPLFINAKNWSVEQNATEVADDVNGEDRSRLDLITNYYSASVDVYQSDESTMQALIDQQTNDDAAATPFKQGASIRIRHRDGTKAAYRLEGVKLGPWSNDVGGRTEPNMLKLKLRFTKYVPVQAIV